MSNTVIESKKKKGTTKLIAGAVALGLAAAGFTYLYIKVKEHELINALKQEEGPKVAVVVAKHDLPQGAPINGQTMAVREIPAELAYPDVVKPSQFDTFTGNFLTQPLGKGTPLLKTFAKNEVAKDFSDTIDVGRRAMTIQVDEVNSISGFIRPGNHIDLFAKVPAETQAAAGSQNPQDVVVPILQDILVLATGRDSYGNYQDKYVEGGGNRTPFTYTTLTVDVSPKQAALLSAAEDKGDLVALLRNRKDRSAATFTEVAAKDLFDYAAEQAKNAKIKAEANGLDQVRELKDGDLIVKNGVVMTKDGKVMKDLIVQPDGTVTTRDGKVVMTKDGKMKKGVILTGDGKIIADPNLVVKNGTIMTKDGVVLSGRGLKVNEDGQIVTKDGKVIDPSSLKVTKDGKVITADGTVLNDTETVLSSNGKPINPDDVSVTKDGFIVTKDGTVMTKDGTVIKGAHVNANGEVVTADGTVLKSDNIKVNDDGSVSITHDKKLAGISAEKVMSKEDVAKKLASGELKRTKDGFLVDKDGNVMTEDGVLLKGAKVNANGEVVSSDGTVLHAKDIQIGADGSVTAKTTEKLEGVTAESNPGQQRAMKNLIAKGIKTREDGLMVAADGTVMTKDGTILKGVTVGEDGKLRTADGTIVDGNNLVVGKDGVVTTKDGKVIKGIVADATSEQAQLMKQVLQVRQEQQAIDITYELIIGGSSKDGMPTINEVPVQK